MLGPELCGHGTFFYDANSSIQRYGNDPARLVAAMQAAGMQHAWVRLHGWNRQTNTPTKEPHQATQTLIGALRNGGIAVAGWGWNQGVSPLDDAQVAAAQLSRYGLTHYVADIEHGHAQSVWTRSTIRTYFSALRLRLPAQAQVLFSTFGFVGVHNPELAQEAIPFVNGFAPQVYWFNHPKAWMLSRPDVPAGGHYPLNDAASYAALCIDMWRHYTSLPIVVTGQAYWDQGESASFDRSAAERKLGEFLTRFDRWPELAGLNWWHFGHRQSTDASGAMSPNMLAALAAAGPGSKFNG